MGPIVGLGTVVKRKISAPAGNRTPLIQPLASHYTDICFLFGP
jgi:hypothetical protein